MVMTQPVLQSIEVGMPRQIPGDPGVDWMRREWVTGIFKSPVEGAVRLGATQLEGDGQADLENHGGPDKAVCVYSADHYDFWSAAFGGDAQRGDALPKGAFVENFTVAGLTEADVCIGDVWAVGEEGPQRAVVQVSQPRQPCWKLSRKWGVKSLAFQVQQNGRTGWYFRVVREGVVAAGMGLALVERPRPEWTVARANRVMHFEEGGAAAAAELARVPELSASWRGALGRGI
jgi:MOSC domain-containing protein YiiM